MGKIYKDQTKLRLQLNTGVAFESADVLKIKYEKPDSTTGELNADELETEEGAIYYDFDGGELDVAGVWKFWAYVEFGDGTSAPGEVVKIKVYEEGE